VNASPSPAAPDAAAPRRAERRDAFEYIVIGSGAGGGPVAANLAKAGKRVLVLEAGGDGDNPKSRFRYAVPGAGARSDPELAWAFWVNSRAREEDRERQHFHVPGKGLYYPRGSTLGGSTAINSLIALCPHNEDWDSIADATGDRSWEAGAMRGWFERLERARHVEPEPGNPGRHGFDGWLPTEQVGTRNNLFKDARLTDYIVSRLAGEENGALLAEAAARGEDFRIDPNDWRFLSERRTGLVDIPRSTENGARRSTRELLLETRASHPGLLEIRTDCLATRLLFDEEDATRVVGDRKSVV
jgi:choline dehydrogenase